MSSVWDPSRTKSLSLTGAEWMNCEKSQLLQALVWRFSKFSSRVFTTHFDFTVVLSLLSLYSRESCPCGSCAMYHRSVLSLEIHVYLTKVFHYTSLWAGKTTSKSSAAWRRIKPFSSLLPHRHLRLSFRFAVEKTQWTPVSCSFCTVKTVYSSPCIEELHLTNHHTYMWATAASWKKYKDL